MIGSMTMASRTIAMAEASGQSRLAKNSFHNSRPTINVSDPPSRSGMTNSPSAGMNTSAEPAAMAGAMTGAVTRKNACHGRAPRSAAASSRLPSNFSRLANSGSTMNGK